MRAVFFGTPDFAVPTLDALVEAGHEIICVVAQPDKPKGRGNQVVSPPTVERARALGLPVRQPRAVKSGPFVDWMVNEARADVGVVVAYGRILIPALLSAPRRGCINVHASLLPKYRGAAPIQHALIEGEDETGVCTMQMDAGLDTGDVLLCRRTPIGIDETGPDLWQRLSRMGAELLVETLSRLDEIEPQPQDHGRATLAPPLTKDDGRVHWSEPARRVHDRVRGTNPWPSGQTLFRGELLKIHRTRLLPEVSGPPGVILEAGERVIVAAGQGAVELMEVQLPNKRRQSGRDFANGSRLRPGERLGS